MKEKKLRKNKGIRKAGGKHTVGKPKQKKIHSHPAEKFDVDENAEDYKASPVTSNERIKKGSIKKHRDELRDLESMDPEFYEYLKDHDADLLNFGEDEEEDDDDIDQIDDIEHMIDSDDEKQSETLKSKKKKRSRMDDIHELDESLVKCLIGNVLSNNSMTSFKKILLVFKSACIPLKDDDNDEDHDISHNKVNSFVINSPELYEFVMTQVIEFAYKGFYKVIGLPVSTLVTESILDKHPRKKNIQLLIISYFKSLMATLSSLVDNVNEGNVSVLLLTSLEKYIPLLGAFPRLSKSLLKILISFWSKDLLPADDTEHMRGHAFLRIRQMTMILPGVIPEESYRLVYLSYARLCKSFTETTYPNVLFMAQCIVELYSIDASLAYQQGFIHIRQLALLVRTAILKKTSESIRQITSWQFLNCLRLWTRVICSMPDQEEMGALAFPLTQVMFGVISMASNMYFIPLRLHLITCMHQLTASCQLYIPVAVKLLDILENPELTSKSTPSSDISPNFNYLTRLPSDSLSKAVVRDAIVTQTLRLIRQNLELYRYHVSLPEYSYLITKKLRQFNKQFKISKWRDMLKPLIGTIDQYVEYVKKSRLSIGKPPNQITEFEALLSKDSTAQPMNIRLAKLLSIGNNVNALTSTSEPNSGNTPVSKENDDSDKSRKVAVSDSVDLKKIESKSVKPSKVKKFKKSRSEHDSHSVRNIVSAELPDQVSALNWLDEDD